MSKDLYYVMVLILLVSIGAAIKYLLDKANVKLSSPILWSSYIVGFVLLLSDINSFVSYVGIVLLLFSSALLAYKLYRFIHGESGPNTTLKKQQVMYCAKCGHRLSQTDTYCSKCGNLIKVASQAISKNLDPTHAVASKRFFGTRNQIANIDEAKKHTKNAWIAAVISGIITLVVSLISLTGTTIAGLDLWSLIDVFFTFGLAYGIYKYSRASSVIMLIYFVICKAIIWHDTGKLSGLPVAIAFTYFFFQGVRGTFVYHKHKNSGTFSN